MNEINMGVGTRSTSARERCGVHSSSRARVGAVDKCTRVRDSDTDRRGEKDLRKIASTKKKKVVSKMRAVE